MGLIGQKMGMAQIYDENGNSISVTVVKTGPCTVIDIKDIEKDGYKAVKIGYKEEDEKRLNKAQLGQFRKNGLKPMRYLREVRLDDVSSYKIGDILTASDVFSEYKSVNVHGVSKGKGYQGVIKRHNFKGGPGGHGSHFKRAPGSIGMCADPSRVFKGTKMPGQMGSENVTVKNLKIIKIDAEKNLVLIKGSIPGAKGNLVFVAGHKK